MNDTERVARDWTTWLAQRLLWMLLAAALACGSLGAGEPPPAGETEAGEATVDYTIVVTGSELLAGAYADAHTPFITRTLRPLGFRCVAATIVDDSIEEIQQAVRAARARTRLVLVTGGLGPTPDDVTRDALSALTGIPLAEHPEMLAELERRFNTPRDALRANLRRQTAVPVRGGYLKNPNGSAAGLVFEDGDGLIVALPGPPRELQPMVRDALAPLLTERFGARDPGCLLMIRFVGIGESLIAETMDRRMTIPEAVVVASLFEGMRVDFFFTLPGASPDDLAQLDGLREEVLRHLGEYVYATDATTLENHVADRLAAGEKTLALAEIGSGGSLAAALGGTQSAEKVLAGAFVAPDKDRLWRMLAAGRDDRSTGETPVAPDGTPAAPVAALARRLAERTGADAALVVGPIRAEAGGARHVEVVLWHEGRAAEHRVALRGTGELARFHLATHLLDLLRRAL
jgi:nicotinamide-nucleotide amidase